MIGKFGFFRCGKAHEDVHHVLQQNGASSLNFDQYSFEHWCSVDAQCWLEWVCFERCEYDFLCVEGVAMVYFIEYRIEMTDQMSGETIDETGELNIAGMGRSERWRLKRATDRFMYFSTDDQFSGMAKLNMI